MTACTPEGNDFDWQGHRGARGLMPENTIPAFLKALEYPVKTLELDVVVSKDNQMIISHEPWMSGVICSKPSGSPISEEEAESIKIIGLNYAEIKAYDCGLRLNPSFPDQALQAVHKPSLRDMVAAVESHTVQKGLPAIFYNIETKSRPTWYGGLVPKPEVFVDLLLAELDDLGIAERTCIQSFDPATLKLVHQKRPEQTTALLIGNELGVQGNVDSLGFVPSIYSPYFLLLNEAEVKTAHELNMKVIPWTVNDTTIMHKLIEMGVDGIITDYPNLIDELGTSPMK